MPCYAMDEGREKKVSGKDERRTKNGTLIIEHQTRNIERKM
jgi:hypothetical protein